MRPALTLMLSPGGEGTAIGRSPLLRCACGQSSRRSLRETLEYSPSAGGEGRGEGGCFHKLFPQRSIPLKMARGPAVLPESIQGNPFSFAESSLRGAQSRLSNFTTLTLNTRASPKKLKHQRLCERRPGQRIHQDLVTTCQFGGGSHAVRRCWRQCNSLSCRLRNSMA